MHSSRPWKGALEGALSDPLSAGHSPALGTQACWERQWLGPEEQDLRGRPALS